jgi:hypothetical protein
MEIQPLVIYPKDVQRIIGKTDRSARYLMTAIRTRFGKERHHLITLGEFCDYTGLSEREVLRRLSPGGERRPPATAASIRRVITPHPTALA